MSQYSNYIINVIKKGKKLTGCFAYTVPTKMSGEVYPIWPNVLKMLFNCGFH